MPDDPAVSAEATPPEPPRKYAGKYESVDALEQGYTEANAEMNRIRQQADAERAQFTQAIEVIQAQATPAPTAQQSFDPDVAALTAAYEAGDMAAIMSINARAAAREIVPAVAEIMDKMKGEFNPVIEAQQANVRQALVAQAEGKVARSIGETEYEALRPALNAMVADNPQFLPAAASVEGYEQAIMSLVKIAQHDTLASRVAELEQERADKLAAQPVTGGGLRSIYTADQQAAEVERIKAVPSGTFSELLNGAA